MLTQELGQKIVEAYLAALNQGDLERILNLYAADASVEDPVGTDPIQGREALAEFYQTAVAMVTAARSTGPVRVAADELVFPFEIESVFEGNKSSIQIIDHFVVNAGGEIQSMRAFWSEANMQPITA